MLPPAAIFQVENLGFCAGHGRTVCRSGRLFPGRKDSRQSVGRSVIQRAPIGATGLGQIWELVTQLRGEAGARQVTGARFAIQENGGGIIGLEEAVCYVGI
jgi:acetyl-CoA acetyltransferase